MPEHIDPRDEELAARVRAGDSDAFAALFKRYYRAMYALAYNYLRSSDEAEDVAESVWIKVWERREAWALRGTVNDYLFTAVRNQAINRLRHQRIRRELAERSAIEGSSPAMGSAPAGAQADLEAQALMAAIETAIAQLPPRCREAFVLRRQHGRSLAEIADIMGTSVRTVEAQITKALRLLRERLAEYLP